MYIYLSDMDIYTNYTMVMKMILALRLELEIAHQTSGD